MIIAYYEAQDAKKDPAEKEATEKQSQHVLPFQFDLFEKEMTIIISSKYQSQRDHTSVLITSRIYRRDFSGNRLSATFSRPFFSITRCIMRRRPSTSSSPSGLNSTVLPAQSRVQGKL